MPRTVSSFQPLVSIVIPNYLRFDLLRDCMQAIPAALGDIPYEVVLVENGSPRELKREWLPKIPMPDHTRLLELSHNVGYPGACNKGVKESRGPLTLILTNDVILDTGAGVALVRALDDPQVGVAGLKLVFPSAEELERAGVKYSANQRSPGKIQHVGLYTNLRGQVIHMYLGWSEDNPRVQALREVYAVTGAAFLTRRKLFLECGGFDPVFGAGCLTADTFVYTNEGIKMLGDFVTDPEPGLYVNPIQTASDDRERESNLFYVNGEQLTVKITTEKDFSIQGTLDHKIKTMSSEGKIVWKEMGDLRIGDWVPVRSGANLFGENHLDPDDAYLCGLYLADGSTEKGGRVTITKPDSEIVEFLRARGFVTNQKIHHRRSGLDTWLSQYVDVTKKALTKEISPFFLCADRETQIALLQGMFDGDGCAIKDGRINYSSSSYKLTKQLQIMLLNFGIVVGIYPRWSKNGDNYLLDFGSDSGKFYERIGFRVARKQERSSLVRESHSPTIPYQRKAFKRVWEGMDRPQSLGYHAYNPCEGVRRDTLNFLLDEAFKQGLNWNSDGMRELGEPFMYHDWVWLQVKKIEDGGVQPTYDLHVPSNHVYLANGFVVHNTYEDVDYCLKVHEKGYQIIVEQQARAKHYTGATAEKHQLAFPLNQNQRIFEDKWRNKLVWTEWLAW